MLANITEEVRKTNPRRLSLLGAFFDERSSLIKRRDSLLKELATELPPRILPLLRVLQLKAMISDAVDLYLLNEQMKPNALLDRVEAIVNDMRHRYNNNPDTTWFTSIRAHFMIAGATLLLSRTDIALKHPGPVVILKELIQEACNETSRSANVCKHEVDHCASARFNLLLMCTRYDPAEGVRTGEALLDEYPDLQPEMLAEVCQETATCHWMQGNWDRAEELYEKALQLDPSNFNAQCRLRVLQRKQREGITSGPYNIFR